MWRRAAQSAQQTLVRYHKTVAPLAVAFGTAWSIRPASHQAAATSSTCCEAARRACHTYGCPLLPQDVYYEASVKQALAKLRESKRDQVEEATADNSESSNLRLLEKSGRKNVGTLTLVGYKGGPLESQINQDRAFCLVPYNLTKNSAKSSAANTSRRLWPSSSSKVMSQTSRGASNSPSEDSTPTACRLIGVFDGHAYLGEKVSQYVVTELPNLLAEKLLALGSTFEQRKEDNICQALKDTFVELDSTAPAEISGGCTASVVLQHAKKIFFANAGDSRSFLVVYRSKSKNIEVVYITREDKPHLHAERERVENMGGKVFVPLNGPSRVLYTDPQTGMQSGLAMSRSIGDWAVGKVGVIADPLVHVVDIPNLIDSQLLLKGQPEDDIHVFVVSATDGMMDYCTPEVVAHTVALSLYDRDGPHLLTALEQLIYFAAQGWEQSKQGRYRDDISIAVAEVRIPPLAPKA